MKCRYNSHAFWVVHKIFYGKLNQVFAASSHFFTRKKLDDIFLFLGILNPGTSGFRTQCSPTFVNQVRRNSSLKGEPRSSSSCFLGSRQQSAAKLTALTPGNIILCVANLGIIFHYFCIEETARNLKLNVLLERGCIVCFVTQRDNI